MRRLLGAGCRSEGGFVLPLAIIALLFGVVLVLPFLDFARLRFGDLEQTLVDEEAYFTVDAGIERAVAYREAGADMIFAEAVTDLADYRRFRSATGAPVLANITEFGKTPLFALDELASVGVDIALYPLSAFRAMSQAAETVFNAIRREGTQRSVVPSMQTREELYEILDYHSYERKLDELFGANGKDGDL